MANFPSTPLASPETAPPGTSKLVAQLARDLEIARITPRKGSHQDAAEYLVLRDASGNERIEVLAERAPPPERKSGTVYLDDVQSFVEYWKWHTDTTAGRSAIYAQIAPTKFVAVLNDHPRLDVEGAHGCRDHRAIYDVKFSDEWSVWNAKDGVAFEGNEAFALFLENNLPDIIEPTASTMMNIALNFRLKSDVQFTSVKRLQDGNIDFGYTNAVTASASDGTQIPETFRLRIPVFGGVNPSLYTIDARFRFRQRESKITLWYELVRPAKVRDQAFLDLWTRIKEATGENILLGKPE